MKRPRPYFAAFTLVEILVGLVILSLIGGIAYSILQNSATLFAKNVSLNSSNTIVRSAMDRVYSEISQANGMPKLIDSNGTAAGAIGPAAGVVFDRYLGGPYVLSNPGPGGLAATAQSIKMTFATSALASPPLPTANDVLSFGVGALRPLVSSCSPPTLPPKPPALQVVTVTLKEPLGQQVSWTAPTEQTAFLVHREAIVVVAAGGRNELRYYPNVETPSNSCDLTTTYAVLTRGIGNEPGENTPFTIVTQNGVSFLNIAMRAEDQQFNNVLANRQVKDFNTFFRVDGQVRPRNFL